MQNNECVFICEQFTDYHENVLSLEVKAQVDAHLTVCPPCRTVFQELKQVLKTLHQYPSLNAPVDFNEKLLLKIDSIHQATAWQKLVRSSYTRVAGYAIAAGLIVALGLNIWIDPISKPNLRGMRSFALEQKSKPQAQEALPKQLDSTLTQWNDSLIMKHNTINSGNSSLQLVSDTK